MKRMNSENFESIVASEKGLFVIKFFSPTCGPCKTMTPVFEALDENNPELSVYEVDTSESPELGAHFEVRGVPYTAFCENREVLYDFIGVTPLGNLQYVVNNIDDPYFRENGEFKQEEPKKTWTFEIVLGAVVLIILFAIIFAG